MKTGPAKRPPAARAPRSPRRAVAAPAAREAPAPHAGATTGGSPFAEGAAKIRARTLDDIANRRGAGAFLPQNVGASPAQLRQAAASCRGCDLYKRATQVVFGEGPVPARVMLVGEQPGDQEDKQGRPFVGPAGGILASALGEAGIERSTVYVTNAVKHFKWTPVARGKRRLHAKPSAREAHACRPWLEREIELVRPEVLILLGATAAQSLIGPEFRVTRERGRPIEGAAWAPVVLATIHPSAVLRAPDRAERERTYAGLVDDLRVAAGLLARVR